MHVYVFKGEHIDYQKDKRDLSFFQTASADVVYACHALEHFGRQEFRDVLAEWVRVLKRGGIIRVAVSELEALVEHYNEHRNIEVITGLIV